MPPNISDDKLFSEALSEFNQEMEVPCNQCNNLFKIFIELKDASGISVLSKLPPSQRIYEVKIKFNGLNYKFGPGYFCNWIQFPENQDYYFHAFIIRKHTFTSQDHNQVLRNIELLKELLERFKYDDLKREKAIALICFENISKHTRICPNCLQKEQDNKLRMVHGKKCPNCEKAFSEDLKFCTECGGKLKYVKYCEKCREKVLTKFCPKCGEQIIQ